MEAAADELLYRIARGAHTVNAPDNLPPEPPPEADEVSRLRAPPHSREAEQSVLGALLLDHTTFGSIVDKVAGVDFYIWQHRPIFSTIEALIAASQPADVISVFEALQRDDKADECGGMAYLHALAQSVPSAANIERHATIVAEHAARRAVIAASDEAATLAFQGRPASEIIERAGAALRHIEDARKLRSRRLPILGIEELIARAAQRRQLVKGLIPAESIGLLFGGSGSFKSYLAVDLGLHVAYGLPFMGRRTTQGPVVYVAAEGSEELGYRVDGWHRARRRKPTAPFYVVPAAVNLNREAWRVVDAVQALGIAPVLIVVDTFSQTFEGEENSSSDVAAYMRELGARFRDLWQCAVLVVHHTGHGASERPRGSSAFQANTDYAYSCYRDEQALMATLGCFHRKGGAPFKDAIFDLAKELLGTDADGDEINTLVARHLSSTEDVQQAMAAEHKAGRGGANNLLVSLLQNGAKETELRDAFYKECGKDTPDARRQAYHRAKKWAMEQGYFEVAEGYLLVYETRRTA